MEQNIRMWTNWKFNLYSVLNNVYASIKKVVFALVYQVKSSITYQQVSPKSDSGDELEYEFIQSDMEENKQYL